MSSLEAEARAGLSGRYEIVGELGRGGMAIGGPRCGTTPDFKP